MTTRFPPARAFKYFPVLLALLATNIWDRQGARSCLALPTAVAAERPLRILIFSGQNNHDWGVTTPKLQSILSNTGRFQVTVTDHPEQFDASTFEGYDALLSNWNTFGQGGTKEWPRKMRDAFLKFVRDGHGLVIVHAGGSSFPDWKEYQELIGGTWGPETGHGPVHRFEVKIAVTDHPVARDFPPFKATDELWHRMASRPGKTVLATAFSASERGGSGQDEPVAFVTQFGQGRCFNLVLGHDVAAMNAAGFQALLGRGTEWAATGRVTLPAPSVASAEELDHLIIAAAGFEPTGSRESFLELERIIAASSTRPALRESLAAKLAARLTSADNLDARKFFCWQLSLVGSDTQVPVIAPLLLDTNLSYYARLALERIPGDRSLAALRSALATTSGAERVGIINSLAVRSDSRVVPDLMALARGNDLEAAAAAIKALGQFGGQSALNALADLEPGISAALEPGLRQAQLECAASLVLSGNQNDATPVLEKLFATGGSPALRAAAFNLYTSALGQQAAPRILAALAGSDAVLRDAAVQALKNAEPSVLTSAAERLGSLVPELQVSLLAILAERHASGALPHVVPLLASKDDSVRMAAIAALGALGDASTVSPLTSLLAAANAAERSAIADALVRMPGKGVDEVLLKSLSSGAPEVQLAAIKALKARAIVHAIPAFAKATANADPEVRREAVRALGQLGGTDSCTTLIGLLDRASSQEVPEIESALTEICRRTADVSPLIRALPDSPTPKKVALLNSLAAVGGDQALASIQDELKSDDLELRVAAVRLVADWPDPSPIGTLGSIALTSSDARSRMLALRGLARLAPLAKDQAAVEAVEVIRQAIPGAGINEQRALLAALGDITNSASLKFGDLQNLSIGATVINLDGLTADGEGGPPSAAIDGNEKSYWDEVDNQKLYVLRVNFKQVSKIAFLRIVGWQQHNFAPRDFEILTDGKLIRKVEAAQYVNNSFRVNLPETLCSHLELRITGSHGPSPAIRELEIYGKPADR